MMSIHLNRRVMMSRILRLDLEQDSLFYGYCLGCDRKVDIDELSDGVDMLCIECEEEQIQNHDNELM